MTRRSALRSCLGATLLLTAAIACGDGTQKASSVADAHARAGKSASGAPGLATGGATAGSGVMTGAGGTGAAANGGAVASGGAANGAGGHAPSAGSNGTAGSGGAAGSGLGGASATAGSSALAGTGAGGIGSGTITLSALTIDANPNMTISCFVSWTTADPASSEVDFGETDYAFRIRDATPVTSHKLLVIGMHAEKAYKLKAVSANSQGTGSLEGTFTTGKLPANVPTPTLNVDDLAATAKGWLLTNIQGGGNGPASVVMYDAQGLPVWYFIQGTHADTRGDVSTELLASNTVLVGPTSGEPAREVDLSGKVLWTGPTQGTTEMMTHFAGKTSTGNYLLNYELDKAVTNGTTKIDDQRLEEVSPALDVVWSWKLFDHIPPAGNREELCHGNMLVLDEAANVLYYNCRFLGLFKIDRTSGDILWRLGGTYDTTSLGPGDFTYSPPESQFSDDHEPELHADGTILLYDNGGYNQGGGSTQNYHSRIVEYQVDQTAKTATRTFEFPGDFTGLDPWYTSNWYSPYWGDADQLPDGNILVTAGVRSASASSRFFEVTRDGKIAWELVLPANNGSFKAQRLAPPPLVEPIQ